MRIGKIRISKYKGISDFEMELPGNDIIVLTGDTGKTRICSFIANNFNISNGLTTYDGRNRDSMLFHMDSASPADGRIHSEKCTGIAFKDA